MTWAGSVGAVIGSRPWGRPDNAADTVTAMVARSGTSFYWPMLLLPSERRAGMFAIYAFCRAVYDVADGPGEPTVKRIALAEWRREIDRIYAGTPQTVIGDALQEAVWRFGLAREDFMAVIDGMEMDAGDPICGPSMAELDLYCDRVACAAGRLSIRAFGAPSIAGRSVADSLGRAFQFTNILRDLIEDAGRGRLYLPRELLVAHGIEPRDPATVLAHRALPEVCNEMAAIAERYFAGAADAMDRCPRATMRPARAMTAIYRRLLRSLVERGWTDLTVPATVPKAMKFLLAARYGLL